MGKGQPLSYLHNFYRSFDWRHLYVISPVWTLIWSKYVHCFPQWLQWYDLSPVCICICASYSSKTFFIWEKVCTYHIYILFADHFIIKVDLKHNDTYQICLKWGFRQFSPQNVHWGDCSWRYYVMELPSHLRGGLFFLHFQVKISQKNVVQTDLPITYICFLFYLFIYNHIPYMGKAKRYTMRT